MRELAVALVIAGAVACSVGPGAAVVQSSEGKVKDLSNQVADQVKRTVALGENGRVFGSGVFVESNLIVTCAHVVGKRPIGSKMTLWLDTDFDDLKVSKEYEAIIADVDVAVDIALLRVDSMTIVVPAKIRSPVRGRLGESVFWIGHPEPGQVAVRAGMISAIQLLPKIDGAISTDVRGFRLDGTSTPGNSGGGVFDVDGNLIGIIDSTDMLMAKKMLDDVKANQNGTTALLGNVNVTGTMIDIMSTLVASSRHSYAFAINADYVDAARNRFLAKTTH